MAEHELTGWQLENKEKAAKLMHELLQLTNAYGSERSFTEGVLYTLENEHPTLQQSFWRAMQGVMVGYSKHLYVDMRNRASVDFCKSVSGIVETNRLPMV